MASNNPRQKRLKYLFRQVINGERRVSDSHDAQLFIEAIQFYEPPSTCVEIIVSSRVGLDALRDAVRVNLSATFILSHIFPLLRYLSDPGIKALVDGQLLQRILTSLGKPPILWKAIFKLFNDHQIPDDQLVPFVWLALGLLSLPKDADLNITDDVKLLVEGTRLSQAEDHDTRELFYRMKNVLELQSSIAGDTEQNGAGGRHDNDFASFRDILIYPTEDEFLSTRQPFYRTAKEVADAPVETRAAIHLDNQFRLLREDMLAELREDLQVTVGKKRGTRQSMVVLSDLIPVGLAFGDEDRGRYKKCCLLVRCRQGLDFLEALDEQSRKRFFWDHPSFLRHQSFGALSRGKDVIGFAFLDRDLAFLTRWPPIIPLQFTDSRSLTRALLALRLTNPACIQFTPVDTPVFAYEPVLKGLQATTELPLQEFLVNPTIESVGFEPTRRLQSIIKDMIQADSEMSDDETTCLDDDVRVDKSQLNSLIQALARPISLIQGPPGTGKSFIGAQIAKYLFQAGHRILVISFTNHALDQFLEDLLDNAHIPMKDVVRLGAWSKCTERTESLLLGKQEGDYQRSPDAWTIINKLRAALKDSIQDLRQSFHNYQATSVSWEEIAEFLEFSDEYNQFYKALLVPASDESGWNRVGERAGKRRKQVGKDYLYQRWSTGRNPGIFTQEMPVEYHPIWAMQQPERESHLNKWAKALFEERLETLEEQVRQFNDNQDLLETQFSEAHAHIVRAKKVIGCTTTSAAKHSSLIRAAMPDVVLVEEAGEILESHVLTALAPSVKQLVLIGDHKQLRPKINNYALSVERGDGFDLNRSLFERLIMNGAAHTTLRKQHRMVPEISLFPRELTYSDLLDGPGTSGRSSVRGLQDRVIFVNHDKPEDTDRTLRERRDPGVKESKKNSHEAHILLSYIRYLGQQGYSPNQIVILTPYLGQLRVLRDLLQSSRQGAALGEMDNRDLIRAGLMSEAAAKVDKKPIRISTIDNYQGEESDIIIVSLTRSNNTGDIGFLSAPERLNVLITRARDCLIMIGNMETFMNSKKGAATWRPFFELLKTHNHLYDGFPVKCERHPEKTAILREPEDFDRNCPDGGCIEPCNALLKCGVHRCTSRCHRVTDHSRAECFEMVTKVCPRQHKLKIRCARQNEDCPDCLREDKEHERRIRRDIQLEEDRLRQQLAYNKQLQDLQDELDHQRRINKYKADELAREQTLEQHRIELAALKESRLRTERQKEQQAKIALRVAEKARTRTEEAPNAQAANAADPPDTLSDLPDTAEAEWNHLKKFENAFSKPMDTLMSMIGLEDVKQEFLSIKSKVDTAVRQGISLTEERFSCSMLGNPGTGKTTVARLYAEFLTDVGVIPGKHFAETTGAGLAHGGVSGCKKLVDKILNDGGGVLFIDEAYQLTSGNNPGGGSVLDYLLAEVENLRGKVVFVLAGYSKQMESFFAHNPGLPSRFPIDMSFADYTDDELLRIFELKVNKKYKDAMDCEDGLRGLYCRIIAKRIGRGRGKEGFGNARTVENNLDIISKRQANRIRRERKAGNTNVDDLFLTKEDLIGPEPAEALNKCEAWTTLQQLIGLASVKEAVKALVDSIQQNYKRELAEQPPIQYSLNKVFLGNPGTGKTTVAKLYGAILVALGLLSKGEVVVKNPSDFVGGALGQSEQQTKGILAATLGKVLVIDEAYGLYGGASTSDPYKTAVIDTIVAEVQSVPGDDRCVLLLGYKEQMETMFQNVNPGLARRFPIASGFNFEDFSDEELRKIFDLKIKLQGYEATPRAAAVAMDMLKRARNRPNFGNAGEIDILLDATKARHQRRHSKSQAQSYTLEPQDFDPDFDRSSRSETNIRKLFEGSVGSEDVVTLLEGYQETVRTFKSLDMDPKENIPFNFLFRGPPGTGKTTTAKKMGKVFYDMGFLSTAEVIECSATDLIGQYVGQTGPKVTSLLDKALGRVLFIDEAYRLAEGHYAKEAMDELVDSVTKERYYKKLIIILAGYEADINRLMSVNTGLTSRFPEVVNFRALSPEECIQLLTKLLEKQQGVLKSKGKDLDLSCLTSPKPAFKKSMVSYFNQLTTQANWASARDVQSLAKNMFNRVLCCKEGLAKGRVVLTEEIIRQELRSVMTERASRSKAAAAATGASTGLPDALQQFFQPPPQQQPPSFNMSTATSTSFAQEQSRIVEEIFSEDDEEEEQESPPAPVELRKEAADSNSFGYAAQRDAGVSDAVWEQLQRDRKAEEEREEEYERLKEEAKKASDAARDKIVKRLLEEEARRKKEMEMQMKLKMMGACPAGFNWIKQAGGYRCAGGSHWMGDEVLGGL
ncbi:P-loop containing nucleoside triphosphate hydrolase protein [Sordaria brevicollis]|uniref:P-loop containing nucleoside triphosphate hydrolase protein n=1 Tax=Sordaria brevicollis TaxID=83679 RepID=A0AAE0UAU6_SORBR|nr:P-loop containing nucleoside triphosphate hydrolase protein [Sordaria brevicollis]